LLVVIAIMAVLAAAGSVAFSGIQRNARNSNRQSDVKSIQNALEQYYAENKSVYPTCASYAACNTSLATYFPDGVPNDPSCPNGTCQTARVNYSLVSSSSTYTLTAYKEVSNGTQPTDPTATPAPDPITAKNRQ